MKKTANSEITVFFLAHNDARFSLEGKPEGMILIQGDQGCFLAEKTGEIRFIEKFKDGDRSSRPVRFHFQEWRRNSPFNDTDPAERIIDIRDLQYETADGSLVPADASWRLTQQCCERLSM